MANPHKKGPFWVRLDNAAKIYPAARRKNWSNLYRQAVTLTDEVDVAVLQEALEVTVKRFPSMAARLRRGVFWYYLQQVDKAPKIRQENSYPLVYMSGREMRRCAFRVIVYRNRIAVEFFHSLTDGYGSLVFLKSLTAEYLQRKYGMTIPNTHGVMDRTEPPTPEELEDAFLKHAGKVAANRKDTDAWRMGGTPQVDGFLHVTGFCLSVKEVLDLARQRGVTMTVLLSAVMMQALIRLQEEKEPKRSNRKRIKLMLPVNLRQLFHSKTLRNFALYITPDIDPRLGEYTFDEICRVIQHTMGLQVTPKYMKTLITTNVNDEKNPLVRLIPLPIKNLVMRAVFDRVGERKTCLSFSNLGRVDVPEEMRPFIQRFDVVLGAQATAPYNCGMLSFGDDLRINFTRNIREPELERHFFAVLQEMGLSVTVESNQP